MADRKDPTRDTRDTSSSGPAADDPAATAGERDAAAGSPGTRRGRFDREAADRGRGDRGRRPREDEGPEGPTDLDSRATKGVVKRTWREFREDNLTDWAAALTYYGILSLFPALLVLVSILGLLGQNATQGLIDNIGEFAPGAAQEIATDAINNLQQNQAAAGAAGLVGLAVALWSASNYVGAFQRASNAIYEVGEGRPFWKLKPLQIGITIVLVLAVALCAVAVVITGPLAQTVGDAIGLGDTAVLVWDIVKWPVIAAIFMTMLAFLYYAAPNVKHPRFRWVSPGGILAVVIWLLASAAFAFYVANFGNYNATYGALGGVIIFLTWMWITNIVILLGAEINAEAERGRQIEAGMPDEREPFLDPRDTRKLKQQ
jgi:membrane protein